MLRYPATAGCHSVAALTLLISLAATAPGQIRAGHAIVATARSKPVRCELFDVDMATGKITPLPRASLAKVHPLALTISPVDNHIYLATTSRTAQSAVLRIDLAGGTPVSKQLGMLPGQIVGLAIGSGTDLYLLTSGSTGKLWRLNRFGGKPSVVASLPRASAIYSLGPQSSHVFVAQSGAAGPPVVDAQFSLINVVNGRIVAGPYRFAGYKPRSITGLIDLATGVPRHVFSHADGSLSLSTAFKSPVKMRLTPALPTGATSALRLLPDARGIVLGGRRHPWLKAFKPLQSTSQQWQMLAGPFPGDPVAFDYWPGPRARFDSWGRDCAGPFTQVPQLGLAGGTPRLGNPAFRTTLSRAQVGRRQS